MGHEWAGSKVMVTRLFVTFRIIALFLFAVDFDTA